MSRQPIAITIGHATACATSLLMTTVRTAASIPAVRIAATTDAWAGSLRSTVVTSVD